MADLRTLQPWLVPYADYLLRVGRWYNQTYDWGRGGGALVITSARRSPRAQAELYQDYLRGRSKIPAAAPGSSLHEVGLAFDMARLGIDPFTDPLLNFLGEIWVGMGGVYGGQWGGGGDPVHYQAKVAR